MRFARISILISLFVFTVSISCYSYFQNIIHQQIQTFISKQGLNLFKGVIHWESLQFNYLGRSIQVKGDQVHLNLPPGIRVQSPVQWIDLKASLWESIQTKALKFNHIKIKDLKLEIEPEQFKKSNSSSSDSVCSILGSINPYLSHSPIHISFEDSEVILNLNTKFPLHIRLKDLVLSTKGSSLDCNLKLEIQAFAQGMNRSPFVLLAELKEKNRNLEIFAKTDLENANLSLVRDSILLPYIPNVAEQVVEGEAKKVHLDFYYSSQNSHFDLKGMVPESNLVLKSFPNKTIHAKGQFSYQPHLFRTDINSVNVSDFSAKNAQINIPLTSKKPLIQIEGDFFGNPIHLTELKFTKPFHNLLKASQAADVHGKILIFLPTSGRELRVSSILDFRKMELLDPQNSKEIIPWTISGKLNIQESRLKNVELQLLGRHDVTHFSFEMSENLSLEIDFQDSESKKNHFSISDEMVSSQNEITHQIQLNGQINRSNIAHLRKMIAVYNTYRPQFPNQNNLKILSIISGNLEVESTPWTPLSPYPHQLHFNPEKTGTHISISGPSVSGKIWAPKSILADRSSVIDLYFMRLHLFQTETETETETETHLLEFENIPNIHVFSNDTIIGKRKLGSVTINLKTSSTGIRAEEIILESPSFNFWSEEAEIKKTNSDSVTTLIGEFEIKDLDQMSTDLNLPSRLGKASGQININLNWTRSWIPSWNDLRGQIDFHLKDGALSSSWSPFQSLIKLVTLDLGNLFDTKSDWSLFNGILKFQQKQIEVSQSKLKLKAATLKFQGAIYPEEKALDLRLGVTPKITKSVIGIALSPVIWVSSHLGVTFSWLNHLFNHQYSLKGPIQDFNTKFVGLGQIEESE